MTINGGAVVEPPMSGPIVFPAGPLPRDVWPLVWSYLPAKGLLYASHTCRGWRADLLGNSRLWAQLDLCAYDANEEPGATPPTFSTAETRSNIWLLENIFPRSKSQLITLDVEVRTVATDDQFYHDLIHFVDLLSPGLAVLRMETTNPISPGEILCDCGPWTFPMLRVLSVSPSAARKDSLWEAGFRGGDMPKLRHFILHGDFRLYSDDAAWANLESLRCTVNAILNIEGLLLSANALQQLTCECLPNPFVGPEELGQLTWPNQPIFDALSRIPDVHVAAVLEPSSVDWIFAFLVDVPRPRLIVEFVVEGIHQLKLKACAQFASATRLTMRRGDNGDSIVVEPEDSTGRFFQIVLKGLPSGDFTPSIDWGLVPALEALTTLRVDAAVWPAVMHRFPRAPLLTDVTLVLRRADDIGVLLRDRLAAQVPPGATLTLTSEPIAVSVGQVADLTAALGVKGLTITGSVEMASS